MSHASDAASPWIARCAELVPAGGAVLDVAAGAGRHTHFFAARGHPVTAVDRDTSRLVDVGPAVKLVTADLEGDAPWPFGGRSFAGVVVTNYLHRPLFPALLGAVAPGGVLLYETFARGHERFGRPQNPDHLLQTGELLEVVRGTLEVVAYEHVELATPALVQRIAARRIA